MPLDNLSYEFLHAEAPATQFHMSNWLRTGGSSYSLYVQGGVLYGPGNDPY